MQIKEVLLRAMNKEYSWLRAAEILGITPRGLRRLRERMEQFGYQGLVDMRRGRPSPRRTPVEEMERILELYPERSGFQRAALLPDGAPGARGRLSSFLCLTSVSHAAASVSNRASKRALS